MDFDSPEVMKDFPGLYMAEKRKGNDSDYNEENEKTSKKEMIIGKRKDKKDKKDKDKGYAALEGESSDEASPCKTKRTKAFIFTKSKDKEKEHAKEKGECSAKTKTKKKVKLGFGNKFGADGNQNIAEALPIFGAELASACQRGKCHDGIHLPLPIRECIDFVEMEGLNFEYVYKTSGNKTKVHHIRKMYNSRQTVALKDYDIPTVTSVLKTFLRDLPEPIFTNDLLIRFEEAGAIFNYNTREKHLRSLINMLPIENRVLLSYLIMHFHNVVQRDQVNKMNKQNLAQALNHTLHVSSRLLQALITHRIDLYPDLQIIKYIPPLDAANAYPDDPTLIEQELRKLDSALNLIHWEMQQGFCSSWRQDQLWDVQRIQTDLKRKLKKEKSQLHSTVAAEEMDDDQALDSQEAEEDVEEVEELESENPLNDACAGASHENEGEQVETVHDEAEHVETESDINSEETDEEGSELGNPVASTEQEYKDVEFPKSSPLINTTEERVCSETNLITETLNNEEDISPETAFDPEYAEHLITNSYYNEKINILQFKNQLMADLILSLEKNIAQEYKEIDEYKKKLDETTPSKTYSAVKVPRNFSQVQKLLYWENHLLEIKKLELVRKIVEYEEQCMDLKSKVMCLRCIHD
ncbi:ralA-binding protein 1 [Euwallacea similis]|uniref:ralA-binding protein 1 n=1 Tax=Euwallacea similis TaxID=1736056 RepID=UPI00344E9A67